jgi:hypothetical protein
MMKHEYLVLSTVTIRLVSLIESLYPVVEARELGERMLNMII